MYKFAGDYCFSKSIQTIFTLALLCNLLDNNGSGLVTNACFSVPVSILGRTQPTHYAGFPAGPEVVPGAAATVILPASPVFLGIPVLFPACASDTPRATTTVGMAFTTMMSRTTNTGDRNVYTSRSCDPISKSEFSKLVDNFSLYWREHAHTLHGRCGNHPLVYHQIE
jgi:hypothetical protein